MKSAIDAAYSIETQKIALHSAIIDRLGRITKRIDKDWVSEISTEAQEDLNIKKLNKPLLIPATEDIKVSLLQFLVKFCLEHISYLCRRFDCC